MHTATITVTSQVTSGKWPGRARSAEQRMYCKTRPRVGLIFSPRQVPGVLTLLADRVKGRVAIQAPKLQLHGVAAENTHEGGAFLRSSMVRGSRSGKGRGDVMPIDGTVNTAGWL
jgi:hypothetical protein